MAQTSKPLSILSHPYRTLEPLSGGRAQLRNDVPRAGSAIVWNLREGMNRVDLDLVASRPGGVALLLILPPAARIRPNGALLEAIGVVRPTGILPHHEVPRVDELAQVLRRPPSDLAADVTDYVTWRGIRLSPDARHIIRRTVELSAEIRSIRSLSRGMYLSRRALGRRFESEGLPVPSHWLHFSRLLRVTLRLQNSDESVVAAGFRVGYPDGFSLSNQMHRLTGYRPSEARRYLGWEWLLEAWLRKEVEEGGLKLESSALRGEPDAAEPPSVSKSGRRRMERSRRADG